MNAPSDSCIYDEVTVIGRVVTATAEPVPPMSSEPDTEAPTPLKKSTLMIITCLVMTCNLIQFISMFSTVAGGFEFSKRLGRTIGPGQANWMAAAYSLTQSAFVLISGRLGAIYGHQNMLMIAGSILVLFSLGNAFCATYTSFVTMRAFTGIGGGILMPNAVALLMTMTPPGKARNFTLAIFAASPPVGAMSGALLVGMFLQLTEWKWFFIFIAVITTMVFGTLFFILPRDKRLDKYGSIDYMGIILGISGLILFNFAWNQAPSAGWQEPYEISLVILSVFLLASFFLWESKYAKSPIMPLSIFATPTFAALIGVVLLTYMSVGIALWYMVAWQQLIRDWTVLQVAVGWIPYSVGASLAVALAAWLIPRLEAKYIMGIGIIASMISLALLATMPEQQTYWAQTFPSIFIGAFCADFVYVAAQIIASNSVGRHEQGIAGSLIGTLNLYGNSLGLGFAGTIETQLIHRGASEVDGFRAALWFGFALVVVALLLDVLFVSMPKEDREGWKEPHEDTYELEGGKKVSMGESGVPV